MDINRNQVFVVGVVLLLLGIQFRLVDAFVLTPKATKLLAEQAKHPVATASDTVETLAGSSPSLPSKTLRPDEWVGWLLLSVGSVLILHSWTMARPA